MMIAKSFGSASTRVVLGLVASLALAGGAFAESTVVMAPVNQGKITNETQVRYADLDLKTEAGQATLERRIRFAASDVCDGANVMNTRSPIAYLNCFEGALRGAREQISERIAASGGGRVLAAR